jgi:hypothetical protein
MSLLIVPLLYPDLAELLNFSHQFQNNFRVADYSPGGIRNSKELRLNAMEAWRTTCPRHSVWEDALIDGHNPGRKRRENE